jgi:hypothetical protein
MQKAWYVLTLMQRRSAALSTPAADDDLVDSRAGEAEEEDLLVGLQIGDQALGLKE